MTLVRISAVVPLEGRRVRLTLNDGTVVERDLSGLLAGPVYREIRDDSAKFREVRVEAGTLVWPNGADLCPDTVIWSGLPPAGTCSASEPDRPYDIQTQLRELQQYGRQQSERLGLAEEDVERLIHEYRREAREIQPR